MTNCERCRAALLDRQYGLLEPAATAAFDAHLAGCPACQAEQLKVERFGRLLSSAARAEFPDVRFVAPPETKAAPSYHTDRPRKSRSAFATWTQWVVAAAIMLAIGIPAVGHWATTYTQEVALKSASAHYGELDDQRREAATKRIQEVTNAQANLKQWKSAEKSAQESLGKKLYEVQQELLAKQLTFSISGPAAPQAGAPTEYQIQVRDNAGKPTSATVGYKVKDQTNKTVFESQAVRTQGNVTARLPADIPLKPTSELFLEVTAQRDDGTRAELREQLKLAAPVYVTHLTTDKPLYQPGEVVRFRSLTLDRASLKPAEDTLNLEFVVRDPLGAETPIASGIDRVAKSEGKPITGPDGKPVQGIGAADWTIPADARGGEYTLAVREKSGRFPEEKRKFLVNQYQPAQLNKELEWSRKSYGPADEVVANCRVTNAAGPVAFQPVVAEAFVDGQRVAVTPCGPTGSDGTVAVRLTLPKQIERGEASLAIQFTDGGNHETLTKPIPVALKKFAVDFYAEGGEFVAGAPNRVYFQVHTTLGKPADIKGRVVDETGRVVAEAETLTDELESGINQGMGVFAFTPEIGQRYRLAIDSPVGTEGEYRLPSVQTDGVALRVESEVSGDPDPIRVRVASPNVARNLLVGAYARGRLLDHQRVAVAANQSALVTLKPEAGIGGVTRVTVFEESPVEGGRAMLRPRAERLVYRKPTNGLSLVIDADKSRYVPGDHVGLFFRATTEKNEPTAAIAMVGVVNKSVVTMADEKTWRAMPTHFLLTSEVEKPEDLERADVLLGSHPKASAALDLLLGTQGWRRFAEQKVAPPVAPKDDAPEAIMVASAQPARFKTDSLTLSQHKIEGEFAPAVDLARSKSQEAELRLERLRDDPTFAETDQRLSGEMTVARAAVQGAQTDLSSTLEWRERTLRWALPAACGVFLMLAIVGLIAGRRRGMAYYNAAAAYFVLAGGAAAMALALNVGDFAVQRQPIALADGGLPSGNPVAPLHDGMAPKSAEALQAEIHRILAETRADGAGHEIEKATGAPANNKPGEGGVRVLQAVPAMAPGALPTPVAPNMFGGQPAPAAAAVAPPGAPPAPKAEPRSGAPRQEGKGDNGRPKGAVNEEQRALKEAVGKPADGDALRRNAAAGDKKNLGDVDRKRGAARQPAGGLPAADDNAKKMPAPMPGPGGGGGGRGGFAGGSMAPGGAAGLAKNQGRFRNVIADEPAPMPFIVREYAHKHVTSPTGDRTDFAETVFWHPVLVLLADGGRVQFDLGDDVTRYQVLVAAHSLDGRLGAFESMIEARKPFSVEPKLPVEVTASDRIDVPVTLANDTYDARSVTVTAQSKGLTLARGNAERKTNLAPEQRSRQVYQFTPAIVEGIAELRLTGKSDGFGQDSVIRKIPVVPDGFPIVGSISDVLEGVARQEVVLPETWVPGTLKCQVNVYPSTLAELQKGLEGLLREPGGCFEQTSTTNYPNALVLQYLKESDQANPAAMKQAKGLLDRGYAKLTAFEVQASGVASAPRGREGFEWFGQAPAHEALTAYGLMQFRDMATVTDVDPQLLARTRSYLLSRRDGKGSFTRNPLALDSFGRAPEDVTNAYIIWGLTEGSKEDDVSKELNLLAEQAKTSNDTYFLALVANCLLNRDRGDEATAILQKLAGKLTKDGCLDGAATSITGSGGRTLQIETTALAVLGWLKSNRPADFTPAVRSAVAWIGKQRGGHGDFGSTQSTILALKALIAYTKANKKTPEAGELSLIVGDRTVSKLAFAAGTQEALTINLPDAERLLKPGKNDVRVEITGKNTFPYTLTWSYQTLQPPSAETCAVKLTTSLDRTELAEGEMAHLNVRVENVSGKGQGMAVAIVGFPAGLKLPDDFAQLKDLAKLQDNGKKPGRIGAFEIRGRELVLYWRDLAPDAKIDLSLDLRAHVPGEFHGPASRSYLYYNPDAKHWTAPLTASVRIRE